MVLLSQLYTGVFLFFVFCTGGECIQVVISTQNRI